MARVKSPKVALTEVTTASQDDFDKLLKTCAPFRTATDARDAALLCVLWSSGLRRSELANLKLDDIDLDLMVLVVRKSKTNRPRRVPFDERACEALLRYLARREMYPVDAGDAARSCSPDTCGWKPRASPRASTAPR
jgi:integrase